jgi:hypothetical protein
MGVLTMKRIAVLIECEQDIGLEITAIADALSQYCWPEECDIGEHPEFTVAELMSYKENDK